MDGLIFLVGCVIIFLSVYAIGLSVKNYIKIRKNYELNMRSADLLSLCDGLIREKDSFKRKNNGVNPCEIKESLSYYDYVGDASLVK